MFPITYVIGIDYVSGLYEGHGWWRHSFEFIFGPVGGYFSIIIFSCFVSFYVLFLEVVDKVHSLHYCSDYIYKQVQRNQCFGQKKYWKMFC